MPLLYPCNYSTHSGHATPTLTLPNTSPACHRGSKERGGDGEKGGSRRADRLPEQDQQQGDEDLDGERAERRRRRKERKDETRSLRMGPGAQSAISRGNPDAANEAVRLLQVRTNASLPELNFLDAVEAETRDAGPDEDQKEGRFPMLTD